jgi:hypothetical protein
MTGQLPEGTTEQKNEAKLKEIYDFALKSLDTKLERKHHFEVKTLYILQATAILITLFVGFQDKISDKLNTLQQINFIFFRNGFFISIAITLVALLASLFDMLFGKFVDLQPPKKLTEHYKDSDNAIYYEHQIGYLTNSIESVDGIIKKKIVVFNIGIVFFFIAIILLICIGFMI